MKEPGLYHFEQLPHNAEPKRNLHGQIKGLIYELNLVLILENVYAENIGFL
jgi:hypothetical protein